MPPRPWPPLPGCTHPTCPNCCATPLTWRRRSGAVLYFERGRAGRVTQVDVTTRGGRHRHIPSTTPSRAGVRRPHASPPERTFQRGTPFRVASLRFYGSRCQLVHWLSRCKLPAPTFSFTQRQTTACLRAPEMTACTFPMAIGVMGCRARSGLVEALAAAIAQPGTSPGASLEGSDEPVRRAPRLDEADA